MDVERNQPRVGMYRESPGSDVQRSGTFKKLKTMKKKFFVLRSTSSSGPARLDYYDSEKKYKTGHPPKRSIFLHTCFNINKKADTKHNKFAVALYTNDDCFSMVMDNEDQQDEWLASLLEYQNEYLFEGQVPNPHYDHVWQGVIKSKSPKASLDIQGIYRLCLSSKSVSLVKINTVVPKYTFQFSSIRRCGHSDSFFFMEVGRSSVTGTGELWLQVDDTAIAQSMHDAVLAEMAAARASNPDTFRRRSNTSTATVSHHRNTVLGDEPFHRKRTASESHPHGSPRRVRPQPEKRPMSSVYTRSISQGTPITIGNSPLSAFDSTFLDDPRKRSDSLGSHCSHTSSHSARVGRTELHLDSTPVTPEGSYISCRSMTPEATYAMTCEDHPDSSYVPMTPEHPTTMPDYLDMTPDTHAAISDYLDMTPDRHTDTDYLPMTPGTPGLRSGTPSPTRDRLDRPGSSASGDSQESARLEGYMDMRPGSSVGSSGNDSGYIDMMPAPKPPLDGSYIVMSPGGRTTAPIAIRPPNKEGGYIDMVPASQPQTLPTVKESGSGEAYLPMTPTGQSPIVSSAGLKPAKVISYLSDDSMSGEFPKRAYSVGSRPTQKTYRHHQPHETHRRPVLDNSRSSSAPHLIIQKSRNPYLDMKNPYESSLTSSPLSQSYKSDDSDSFMEIDFYRPRTASDSYGYRPRSSSFGKQYTIQGHRPRSSSYGQSSRGKPVSKLAMSRVDSYESVRMKSQELKRRSQESLDKFSCSSRNSSSDSLKKLSEENQQKTNYLKSGYMDMAFEKHKTPSPNPTGVSSPISEGMSYVDMTLGTSVPKTSRGVSPSSSSHSLGSSPASVSHGPHEKPQEVVVVKASGHMVHKPGFSSQSGDTPSTSSANQLRVNSRLVAMEKRSPSSSGRESEDESYVPFQPGAAQKVSQSPKSHGPFHGGSHGGSHGATHGQQIHDVHVAATPKSHPGIKVHHGYSRSYDSGLKSPDHVKKKSHSKSDKSKKEDKMKDEKSRDKKHKDSKQTGMIKSQDSESKDGRRPIKELAGKKGEQKNQPEISLSLIEKVSKGSSPTIDRKMETIEFIPDSDIFSNKPYQDETKIGLISTPSMEDASYIEYLPGFEVPQSPNSGISVVKPKIPCISEYMEIDPADVKDIPESVSVSSNKVPSPKTPSGKFVDDRFSYMDFDPSRTVVELESQFVPIKKPVRVQSFISQIQPAVDENKSEPMETVTSHCPNITPAGDAGEKTGSADIDGAPGKTGPGCDETGDSGRVETTNSDTGSVDVQTLPTNNGCAIAMETCDGVISERVQKIDLQCEGDEMSKVAECDNDNEKVACGTSVDVDTGVTSDTSADVDTSATCEVGPTVKFAIGDDKSHSGLCFASNITDTCDINVPIRETDIGGNGEQCNVGYVGVRGGEDKCCIAATATSGQRGNKVQPDVADGHGKFDKTLISRSHSLDEPSHKKMITKSLSAKTIGTYKVSEPVWDEGYVDLDFSENGDRLVAGECPLSSDVQPAAHKRSSSSSSSNSEKSRSIAECPLMEEEDLPVPETPRSYISEDAPESEMDGTICCPETSRRFISEHTESEVEVEGAIRFPETSRSYISEDTESEVEGIIRYPESSRSYIFDDTKITELGDISPLPRAETGSPFRQISSTSRIRVKSGQKSGNMQAGGMTASGDNARKSFPLRSGQIPSPINTGLSRQTSAPAVPSYSPRTASEIQTTRNRKTSGPPDFPCGSRILGGHAIPSQPKRQCTSDAGIAGQEQLQKQVSMPAMAVPSLHNLEQKYSISANLQDTTASRHSFSDLSEYVSMSFPAELSENGQPKSNSQQQLSQDSTQEQQAVLNYAQLDIGGSSENIEDKSPRSKSRHPSSIDDLSQLTNPISYAEIDYKKTENLKNSGNKDVKFTL